MPPRTSLKEPAPAARKASAKVARKAPAPAAPPSRDELTSAAREALHTLPGMRAADLKKRLPKALQARHAEVLEILRELAAGGEITRYVTAKVERFFAADPIATLDRVVPEILTREGPLDATALKKAVTAAAPGHVELVAEWLKMALARRLAFEHAPAPKGRTKRFGSTPDLTRLLGKTLVELHKAITAVDEAGVPRERVVEALRRSLGLPIAPSPVTPRPAAVASAGPAASGLAADVDVVHAALVQLASEDRPGTLLLVEDLRARTALDKERFDAATLALSREGLAVLHHHDHPAGLSEEQRRALVAGGRGVFFHGIAPRSPS